MLVEALWRGQGQEADFAVHGDLSGPRLVLPARLKKMRPDGEAAVLRLPHSHLHLALSSLALASLVPTGLALLDITAVLKRTVWGKRTDLAVDMLSTIL